MCTDLNIIFLIFYNDQPTFHLNMGQVMELWLPGFAINW